MAGALVGVVQGLAEERLARREVVVHQRRRDPGRAGDPRDADLVDAMAGNQLTGDVEDALATAARAAARDAAGTSSARARS
jgi:hypothetical protein